jgi:orotate phosphoribosyltransferase
MLHAASLSSLLFSNKEETIMSQSISESAARTARILFEIKAVLFNAKQPFILTSGSASPVYIDVRKLIAFPRARRAVIAMMAQQLQDQAGAECFDAVAGGETAGIAYAAWLAETMALPMLYVRKQPKGFGRMAQIEGDLKEGQRVLLVEDLSSQGTSKVKFVEALRAAGAVVEHIAVVFHYGIFPASDSVMQKLGVKLHALCTWQDALRVAREQDYFDTTTLDEVAAFLASPDEWSARHGGKVA